MAMQLVVPLLVCSVLLASCASSHRHAADRHVRPYARADYASGIVVHIAQGESRSVLSYTDPAHPHPRSVLPDGEKSLFETGSVGKVLTALLLAESVDRGLVGYDDPAPAALGLDRAPSPILLRHLATHTSALPRSPDNIDHDTPNPYEGYTRAHMEAALGRVQFTRSPGDEYDYSNLAYGLLGAILADAGGASYTDLLHDRVLDPLLGPSRAWTHLSRSEVARLAPAHAFGEPSALWGADDALAPAGCVVTDAGSLAQMLERLREAVLSDSPGTPIARALRDSWEVRHRFPDGSGVALAWHVTPDGTRWHNGSTGGYHSFVALNLEYDLAVVVLANDVCPEITDAGFGLFDALAGLESDPPALPALVSWSEAQAESVVGVYTEPEGGAALVIESDDRRISARLADQPAYRVFPRDDVTLGYRVVDAQLICVFDDAGICHALDLVQDGYTTRFERAAGAEKHPE